MNKTALEYTKFILEKVSFDPQLFKKEYYKAIKRLVEDDVRELRNWVVGRFNKELTATLPG